MSITPQQALEVFNKAECLHDAGAVLTAIAGLADAITQDLHDSDPLVITIMQGGLIPAGLLLPRLDFPLQADYLHASRYRGNTSGGEIHWLVRPETPLEDRTVLLVDDIFDEGHTLAAIVHYCREAGARRVRSAVLADKLHDRKADYRPDYIGLEVEDRYVFGFGMDYKEYLRNAPGIYAVSDEHV